jgi:hypothetical protein
MPNDMEKLVRELPRYTEIVALFKKNQRRMYDCKILTCNCTVTTSWTSASAVWLRGSRRKMVPQPMKPRLRAAASINAFRDFLLESTPPRPMSQAMQALDALPRRAAAVHIRLTARPTSPSLNRSIG